MTSPFSSAKIEGVWFPWMPWGAGSLHHPRGLACLLCINVHSTGGWAAEVGPIKNCALLFKSQPVRLHAWLSPRARLLELGEQNPGCRIRSARQD